MRRTMSVPRSAWRFLLVGLLLTLGTGAALAQDVSVLVVPVNTTKRIEMSKKQVIAAVGSENPKIVRVQSIIGDPTAVLVTGLAPGTSRVTLEDTKKIVETFDVNVSTEDRVIREQLRKEFLLQIGKIVPTAKIDVVLTDKATIITGTAPDINSQRVILDTARQTFGGEVVAAINLPGQEAPIIAPRVQQVELEVMVAVVNRSEVRSMSFNWVVNRNNYFVSSLIGTAGGGGLNFANGILTGIAGATQSATGNPNLQFGVVGNRGAFSGFLEALRNEGIVKVMAEPRIVTMSGQKANILSGGDVPVITVSGVGASNVEYKEFGTSVDFTPVVLENGKIQLDVTAQLKNVNAALSLNFQGNNVAGFDRRTAHGVVQIEDSQTLAIGGLIQNTVQATSSKVPFLGDIPFLGAAFSSTRYDEREEEMIILVTPRLVDPMSCNQLPRTLPGRETRSPDDFELFMTQILEAPRGQREVCPDGRFRAAHRNGPTAGVYPCGDNSRSHGWNRRCTSGHCGQSNCSTCGTGSCASGNCGHTSAMPQLLGNQGAVTINHAAPLPLDVVPVTTLPNQGVPSRDTLPALPTTSYENGGLDARPALPASLGPIDNGR